MFLTLLLFFFSLVLPLILFEMKTKSVTVATGDAAKGQGDIKRHSLYKDSLISSPHSSIATLYDLLKSAVALHGSKNMLGARKVVRVVKEEKEVEKRVAGEVIKETKTWNYFELSSFEWISYQEAYSIVLAVGAGLKQLGLNGNDKVTLFASTGRDWMLMAHACFTQSLTITTAYDTLGEEGLTFSLNEGSVTTLFTNGDLLGVVKNIVPSVASLKNVIYTGDAKPETIEALKSVNIQVFSFQEIQDLGKEHPREPHPPSKDDLACIMYTSGSTGNPKGVMLTHANIVSAVGAAKALVGGLVKPNDVYLSFLPLAHILEFTVEQFAIYAGISLGYGNVRTLTDASVRNCKGDMSELKPSWMAGVPAVWESVRKGILSKLKAASPIAQKVFHFAMKVKWALMKAGLPSGLIDKVVFKKIKESTGGRLRIAISGGAPIPPDTHQFLNICLTPIIQGYGMTETVGTLAIQDPSDITGLGIVGPPVPNCEVMLVAVENTSYSPLNKEKPQGEVWVRGPSIMQGYYRQEKATNETMCDGWLMTGDIGEWRPDGSLAIIDRKKNLIKLSNGEYIALEKLESLYKMSSLVQNLCIYGDSHQSFAIAIVTPIPKEIETLASQLGISGVPAGTDLVGLSEAVKHPDIRKAVLKDLLALAKRVSLKPAEVIGAVVLVNDEWTPVNGLLTAAQKLKRMEITKRYQVEIDAAYGKKDGSRV